MLKIAIIGNSRCAEEFVKLISNDKNVELVGWWIPENLPRMIEDLSKIKVPEFIFLADIVLDYTKHQDMPYLLRDAKKVLTTSRCSLKNVVFVEFFCAVNITEKFGIPKFKVHIKNNKIEHIDVLRSSPCGAAFVIADKLKNMTPENALNEVGLLIQYECKGKGGPDSSIHKAAEIHKKALADAIIQAGKA